METMRTCFTKNRDGAGFMYPTVNGTVYHKKGIMTWEEFETTYKWILETMKVSTPMVFHFRIGTHGAKGPTMTHPFAVSDQDERLKSLSGESDYAFVHNGVLSFLGRDSELSDTALYVKKILFPLTMEGVPKVARDAVIAATVENCRFAYMDGQGNITKFGSWEEEGGISYSNAGFRPYVAPTTPATHAGSSYYDEEYWSHRGGWGGTRNTPRTETKTKQEEITFQHSVLMLPLVKPVLADGLLWDPKDFEGTLFVHAGEDLCAYDALSKEYFFITKLDGFADNLRITQSTPLLSPPANADEESLLGWGD